MFGPTPQSLAVAVSCIITPKHLKSVKAEALKAASSRPSSMSPKNDFRTAHARRPRLSCAATFAPVRCSLLTPFWVVYCSVGSDL